MKNLDSMEQIMMEPAMEEYKETQRKLQEEGDPLASLEGIPYESSADDIRREKLLNEAALAILALLLLGKKQSERRCLQENLRLPDSSLKAQKTSLQIYY